MPVDVRNKQFRQRKPAASTEDQILALPKGKAFSMDELTKKFGVKTKTIDSIARKMDCLFYYRKNEQSKWEPYVMHPETATKVSKDAD